MKRVSILYVLFACLAGLLSACGNGNTDQAQLSLSTDLTSLTPATVNLPYNQTITMTASGGTSPYLYSCAVSSGAGLSASVSPTGSTTGSALCVISGTPLNTGAVTINFSVTDSKMVSAFAGTLSVHILTADPLANWHVRNYLPHSDSLSGVTYGNGTFVAVGTGDVILTSPDGATWTARILGTPIVLRSVTYGNGTFVAVGNGGTILTSPDGATWTARISGTTTNLSGVTYGNGTFVAVGYAILTSPDGVTWTSRNSGSGAEFSGVTYGNGTFVAVGDGNVILTSPDGVTWISHYVKSDPLSGVTYGNDIFVAVGWLGGILTSPDGATWTSRNSGTTAFLYGVTYGNGIFVAVNGGVLTSPDGVTWTSRNSGINASLSGVTYGNDIFVAVGRYGTVIQSDPME